VQGTGVEATGNCELGNVILDQRGTGWEIVTRFRVKL